MMTLKVVPISLSQAPVKERIARAQPLFLGLMLALVLSACSGTRELGPTAFIDADTTDYIKDDRDFPKLGKYDDAPPVTQRPANVLDLVKSLPETVRAIRNRDDVADETDDNDMMSADAPAEKPEPVVEEVPAPNVPANDIAKSLIGDLSSNGYTEPVLRDDFRADAGTDVFEPVPLRIVSLPDRLRFAPQLVVPKTLSAPKTYSRKGVIVGRRDLATLRQSVYLAKLTQSSARAANASGLLQFAQSSLSTPIMTAERDRQPKADMLADKAADDGDQSFIVLGRINADGFILSANSQRVARIERDRSGGQIETLKTAVLPARAARIVVSSADRARQADRATIALLTEVNAPASSAGFAAR